MGIRFKIVPVVFLVVPLTVLFLVLWLGRHFVNDLDLVYDIAEEKLCYVRGPNMVIFVPSAIDNIQERNRIRETWGKGTLLNRFKIVQVFVIGRSNNSSHDVVLESKLNRDIIKADVPDDYNSLSYKTLVGLHWAVNHCSKASYVVKSDDDILLNPQGLLNMVSGIKAKLLLCGRITRHAKARRHGKWALNGEVYYKERLPYYIAGNTYAMSIKVARRLYAFSKLVPLFPLEDVYLTGMVAKRAKVPLRHCEALPEWSTLPNRKTIPAFIKGELVGLHMVPSEEWKETFQMLNLSSTASNT